MHRRSSDLYSQALQYMPGGVNSPVRSWGVVGGSPLFLSRGKGSHVWDIDGRGYIDYVGSWGPLVLGHTHKTVLSRIKEVLASGTSFGAPTEIELEMAREVVKAFPSVDMVRFVNSGTEATMSALRLARAFTGRDKIIKFRGGYHGHADALLVRAGSGVASLGISDSAGVPQSFASDTIVAEYNDLRSVENCFNAQPNQIACVIVEPIAGNMGVIPPKPEFLNQLRDLTAQHNSLLIFDEVITGFRVAYGGAQELYQVTPDITCFGKIIGGGLPVGAYGGRGEIMEHVAPLGSMYQAGTLSGNPVAMAAGLATLELLRQTGTYEELDRKTSDLTQTIEHAFLTNKQSIKINRVGSMFTLFFTDQLEVDSWEAVQRCDVQSYSSFFHRLLDLGVYFPPSPFESAFVSLAHTPRDLKSTGKVIFEAALKSELRESDMR